MLKKLKKMPRKQKKKLREKKKKLKRNLKRRRVELMLTRLLPKPIRRRQRNWKHLRKKNLRNWLTN